MSFETNAIYIRDHPSRERQLNAVGIQQWVRAIGSMGEK